MIHKNEYDSEIDLRDELKIILNKASIWTSGPYVIEELAYSVGGDENSPSIEVFVDGTGPKITYVCNQIVSQEGVFLGILMGKKSLGKDIVREMNRIGKLIGSNYFKLGYRGFFDIDFIVSKNRTLYPIETNVRRTGGTHVYDLTRKLFGRDWVKNAVALSTDSFNYGKTVLSAEEIINKISSLTFPIKGEEEGVVVVAVDSHEPYFSFIIFAPTKSEVLKIHDKLTSIWDNDTLK